MKKFITCAVIVIIMYTIPAQATHPWRDIDYLISVRFDPKRSIAPTLIETVRATIKVAELIKEKGRFKLFIWDNLSQDIELKKTDDHFLGKAKMSGPSYSAYENRQFIIIAEYTLTFKINEKVLSRVSGPYILEKHPKSTPCLVNDTVIQREWEGLEDVDFSNYICIISGHAS